MKYCKRRKEWKYEKGTTEWSPCKWEEYVKGRWEMTKEDNEELEEFRWNKERQEALKEYKDNMIEHDELEKMLRRR